MNRRDVTASRLSSAATAALSVFLLFCGPIADCCPLAVPVSAQTEHGCCLDAEQSAPTTATTAAGGAIPDRALPDGRALGTDENGVSSAGRRVDPVSILTLPPARAVLTVRLRI